MATTAERVGRGPCPHCGQPVTFKRTSGKLLRFNCDNCLSSAFADPGGSAHKQWLPTIKADATDAQAPAPNDPPTKPAPKPKVVNMAFSLADV